MTLDLAVDGREEIAFFDAENAKAHPFRKRRHCPKGRKNPLGFDQPTHPEQLVVPRERVHPLNEKGLRETRVNDAGATRRIARARERSYSRELARETHVAELPEVRRISG